MRIKPSQTFEFTVEFPEINHELFSKLVYGTGPETTYGVPIKDENVVDVHGEVIGDGEIVEG